MLNSADLYPVQSCSAPDSLWMSRYEQAHVRFRGIGCRSFCLLTCLEFVWNARVRSRCQPSLWVHDTELMSEPDVSEAAGLSHICTTAASAMGWGWSDRLTRCWESHTFSAERVLTVVNAADFTAPPQGRRAPRSVDMRCDVGKCLLRLHFVCPESHLNVRLRRCLLPHALTKPGTYKVTRLLLL